YRSNTNTYQITMRATASNGNTGSGTYNLAAPTVQSVSAGTPVYDASTGDYTIPVTVTLSNGYTDTQCFINLTPTDAYNAGKNSVTLDLANCSYSDYWDGRTYVVENNIALTNGVTDQYIVYCYP
ncbi:MAG: hypothetical protein J5556_03490, partial [Deltaproteobacteria bacterium]|nr:hypothetical protein [Deltaproteobacteria bacterium]